MRPSFGPLTLDWPHRLNPVFDAASKEVQVEKRLEFTQWSQISLSLSCCLFASVSLYSVMQCWPGQSDSGLWSIYSLVWSGPRWPDLSSEWVLTQSFTDLNIYDITSTSLRSTGKKNIWVEDHRWSVLPMNISKLFSVVLFYCNFFNQFCIFVLFLKKSVTFRLSFNSFFKFLTTKFVDIFFFLTV